MDQAELERSLAAWQKRLTRRKETLARVKHELQKARAMVIRRQRQIENLSTPVGKAVRYALDNVGTVEKPAFSNRGPLIDYWQQRYGFLGQPWCGMFVGWALHTGGVKGLTSRVAYVPYIEADAKAGRNGFEAWVGARQIKRGDAVCFDFGGDGVCDHVGLALEDYKGKGVIRTVEGNTSPGNTGSQDNGGGVYVRTRPIGLVKGAARPRWP